MAEIGEPLRRIRSEPEKTPREVPVEPERTVEPVEPERETEPV